MKVHLDKRVLIGFSATALILTVLGIYAFTNMQRLINTAALLSHASQVINTAERVIKQVIDIETGQRGYVITGSEAFLEPFYESSKSMTTYLQSLDSLTQFHREQHKNVMHLQQLINAQRRWTSGVVSARNISFDSARNLVVSGVGKNLTDSIRQIVLTIQADERLAFQHQNTTSALHLQQFQFSFLGLVITVALIIAYLFYAINSTLNTRLQAEQRLKQVADETQDLYDNAPCGYFSVDAEIRVSNINHTLIRWLGYTREEVVGKLKFEDLLSSDSRVAFLSTFNSDFEIYKRDGYVNDLEFEFQRKDQSTFPVVVSSLLVFDEQHQFAGSRTTVSDNTERKKNETRISQLNRELESFTYSVSHDLRAPLRSITGYAQILIEDYKDKFDDEAMRLAKVIVNNANRMGLLIDDLLDFSRLGRKELMHTHIEMNELVVDIVQDFHESHKIIEVEPLLDSKGDINMIRQVWTNLISNAIKYSGKTENPKITIGSKRHQGSICYYITDNGVGFDMRYANKLFGVFQRLHKVSEFEGTGVGLALVKTIIERHGGQVWGEGKIDFGATFYFTLPKRDKPW